LAKFEINGPKAKEFKKIKIMILWLAIQGSVINKNFFMQTQPKRDKNKSWEEDSTITET